MVQYGVRNSLPHFPSNVSCEVSGEFADILTAVIQVADLSTCCKFDGNFGVNNHSKCDIKKFAVRELTSPQIVKSMS